MRTQRPASTWEVRKELDAIDAYNKQTLKQPLMRQEYNQSNSYPSPYHIPLPKKFYDTSWEGY